MSVKTIKIVEDNTAPALQLTLKRDGVVINVTDCAVSLIIAKGSTVTNTGHQTCTLTTPASGIVTYPIATGDFATPGQYRADAKITYGDNTVETLYDQLKIKVRKKLG